MLYEMLYSYTTVSTNRVGSQRVYRESVIDVLHEQIQIAVSPAQKAKEKLHV